MEVMDLDEEQRAVNCRKILIILGKVTVEMESLPSVMSNPIVKRIP